MAEFQLYCFAQSGNAYRAALMLNLIGADWEPVWVDFFGTWLQRTPEFRNDVNEMGEAPVLVHGKKKLTQSGVILTYLARRTGKFKPEGEDEELEALRWIIFDNQKVNGFLGSVSLSQELRQASRRSRGPRIPEGPRIDGNLAIVNKRLTGRKFLVSDKPTIADVSMTAYFYYPAEEFGFDIAKDYPAIGAWLERMKALPGWKHPYELMPGYPFGTELKSVQPRRPLMSGSPSGGLAGECLHRCWHACGGTRPHPCADIRGRTASRAAGRRDKRVCRP